MILCILILTSSSCSKSDYSEKYQIYLYGELHAVEEEILEQYDIWKDFYDNHGMRNLFIEQASFTADYLNIWMKADDNQILDKIFDDLEGTFASSIYNREFFEKIKKECPETMLYGTDIGHQYDTTGKRFLSFLEDQDILDKDLYQKTKENIDQGKIYYKNINTEEGIIKSAEYREYKLAENFIQTFDKLEDKRAMGIYGGYHVSNKKSEEDLMKAPAMVDQLRDYYGDIIYSRALYDRKSFEKYKDRRVEDIKVYR